MNNSFINIVYCTDSNYLEHVGVSITSILLNNKRHNIHFHVFLYDVSEEEKNKLQEISSSITLYSVSIDELNKYFDVQNDKIKHINRSMYIRLSVPRLLPKYVDKFIYLDADILCFGDISSILNVNIDSVVCAVTADSLDADNMLQNKKRLNLASEKYFNSGFLYINIQNWKKFDTENKANQILLSPQNYHLLYPDQDALNIVLQNQVSYIDVKWNYLFTWINNQEKETFFDNKKRLPCFIHFTGARKIWYQEHKGLAQNLYCFYRHFTPWSNCRLKSYKSKMRVNDYRIYAKSHLKDKNLMSSLKYYLLYFLYKLKGK
ncbi:glycosyltransferase family 8 protein [Gilliamella sp. B2776]|uniref:glycosyltransferase family 8 protein n=1 Tax=unclassified Gilliamella TaxID=2685620 RepID=UPI00226A9CCD|nr:MULTISPECIES: glycosyltransferase family 8 protein [unclassified Gilliamella]MCX8649101.1 glycosyltransferase family 8 protein [Gilliamella sp. B2779]MCX8653023.1 glycosyltransferase family 8 protein [Gilliamella sp. B2737]MCX8655283.1 glycosyltransferase family 8 protein [Gilliamella sp. B2894]MCX8664766.1 glycosyltransferase family 8 protein [Gilliamella sp. B2887]MCX8690913.1 glycosyltransferase family 8 protein [Gilliamella sp. B2776]